MISADTQFVVAAIFTLGLCVVAAGIVFGYKIINIWQENSERQRESEIQRANIERENLYRQREVESIRTQRSNEGSNDGGFIFIDMDEGRKKIFVDAFMGFEDYAKLKGYDVSVIIDYSIQGKVGIKVTVNDRGVTVSREKVERDVGDFVKRMMSDEDFSDMPMTTDPILHNNIVIALNMRLALLKQRATLSSETAAAYRNLLAETREITKAAISYARPEQSPYFQIEARGGNVMRDKFVADKSPGAIQGRHNTSIGSKINIGTTIAERVDRVNGLSELIDAVDKSDLPEDKKSKVKRYIENAKEELSTLDDSDKNSIHKWLKQAKDIIDIGEGGKVLAEKAKEIYDMFIDGNLPPGTDGWI